MTRCSRLFGLALLGCVILTPHTARPILAQSAAATIVGTVGGEEHAPIRGASIQHGSRVVVTDSLGQFVLDGLRGTTAELTIRQVGFQPVDTTVALRAGRSVRLDVVLGISPMVLEHRRQAALAGSAGTIDSGARGLLSRDTSSMLTFGRFGVRLLAAAVAGSDPEANTVLSPVSAAMALSLALLGAGGTTATDLSRTLDIEGLDRAELERRGASLTISTAGRTDVELEIQHAVWVSSDLALSREFAASARAWRATVDTLRLPSPAALLKINSWADSVTHGRIPKILDEPLSDSVALFIASSVYFKGKWLVPFEKSRSRHRDFNLPSGERISVPMMERTGSMLHSRAPGYQMVRLPYRGGLAALYVILPDSGALDSLLQQFAEVGWPVSLDSLESRDVQLVLPRVRVELELDLGPLVHRLGAGVALDCDRADFHNLAVDRASGLPFALCIGRATQNVYLDMDEEGTEAAAVTGLEMMITSVPPPPIPFIVDRTFILVLRDETSGADLFVGVIKRP